MPYASIASINWSMCAVLPPIVQSIFARVGHIDIITAGCCKCSRSFHAFPFRPFPFRLLRRFKQEAACCTDIMGAAPFVMVLSDSVGAAALWNVLYTLGEVLWSPRTQTLAAQIAPQGMEATFFSLAAAPQFAAKWPTGLFSVSRHGVAAI